MDWALLHWALLSQTQAFDIVLVPGCSCVVSRLYCALARGDHKAENSLHGTAVLNDEQLSHPAACNMDQHNPILELSHPAQPRNRHTCLLLPHLIAHSCRMRQAKSSNAHRNTHSGRQLFGNHPPTATKHLCTTAQRLCC